MPADPLTLITAAIFATALLVFVTLALLVSSAVSVERRRWRRRLNRATGLGQRYEDQAAQEFMRSVRRIGAGARRTPADRVVATITPGYDHLAAKLAQGGLRFSATAYVLVCYVLAAVVTLGFWLVFGVMWPAALGIGVGTGVLLPYGFLRRRASKRTERFLAQLPDALDLMTRGLKSGLPILESIEAVAQDFEDPVRSHFATVHNRSRLGTPLEDALWDLASELKIQEFNFFAISVSIQRETGGNLTENLQNLSRVLRRRQNMKQKVKALSSEARASAYILVSLPFAVAALITAINPAYMTALYQDPRGLVLVAAALVSIGLGIAVMVKMVNFEI